MKRDVLVVIYSSVDLLDDGQLPSSGSLCFIAINFLSEPPRYLFPVMHVANCLGFMQNFPAALVEWHNLQIF